MWPCGARKVPSETYSIFCGHFHTTVTKDRISVQQHQNLDVDDISWKKLFFDFLGVFLDFDKKKKIHSASTYYFMIE